MLLSGALFFARGTSVLAGASWPMRKPVRLTSYAIDSVLLAAALALAAILPVGLFANGWLTAKIVLLLAYIALGTFALKRARTQRTRALCFVGAVAMSWQAELISAICASVRYFAASAAASGSTM